MMATAAAHSVSWNARLVMILALIVLAAYVAALAVVTPGFGVAFALLTHLAYAAPGVAVVRRISSPEDGWLPALTIGPLLGAVLTDLTLLALWASGARGAWLLVVAPAVAALLAWPAVRMRGRWQLPPARAGDGCALLLVLLLGPIVLGPPLSRVGETVPDGRAYHAYFTADFVWQRAAVAELAKGEFLPANPYFVNDVLHYYWLPHLPSAIEYRAAGASIDLDALLLSQHVLVGAGFLALLYGFVRQFVTAPWAAAAAVWWVVLCSSFEGVLALWSVWHGDRPWFLLRSLNVDGLTRWWFGGMPVDGLQRMLWYHPHHEIGTAAGLTGLLAVARRRRDTDPAVLAIGASLLGLGIVISSFTGLVATAATALFELGRQIRLRQWGTFVVHAASGALPLALAAALVMALAYVDGSAGGGGPFILGLNPIAAVDPATIILLSFGPVVIPAVAGAWLAWRRGLVIGSAPLTALLAVSIAFYFFVDIRDIQGVYVGFRIGPFLFILMAPFVAAALMAARATPRWRWVAGGAFVLLGLAAFPTAAIDWFNTQDVMNRAMGPGFRWTLVLSPDEQAGLAWLRHETATDARVQVDPIARGADTWAYVPAFAERRMATGLPISMTPLMKYQEASRRVQLLFDADIEEAFGLAERVGIDYVLIGEPERDAHPGVDDRYRGAPDRFEPVFRNGAMAIYRVRHLRPF